DDVRVEAGEFVISTEAAWLPEGRGALLEAGLTVASAQLTMVARNEVALGGRDGERLLKLLDLLDDHDDVQQVHSNADPDESVLARVS
ncbi:MAG: YebC/PmpR family DNA-binding transcriptional regulator, partial [Gemmatimonadetes bacterium]|nr:YebC/PmpR family DNA-binding transcriptional regulator [Gemmatimonadota bacterium]